MNLNLLEHFFQLNNFVIVIYADKIDVVFFSLNNWAWISVQVPEQSTRIWLNILSLDYRFEKSWGFPLCTFCHLSSSLSFCVDLMTDYFKNRFYVARCELSGTIIIIKWRAWCKRKIIHINMDVLFQGTIGTVVWWMKFFIDIFRLYVYMIEANEQISHSKRWNSRNFMQSSPERCIWFKFSAICSSFSMYLFWFHLLLFFRLVCMCVICIFFWCVSFSLSQSGFFYHFLTNTANNNMWLSLEHYTFYPLIVFVVVEFKSVTFYI